MTMSIVKISIMVMLMMMFIVIQVECIPQSQDYRSIKLAEPFCEIKCDAQCLGKQLSDEFDKCVKECRSKC